MIPPGFDRVYSLYQTLKNIGFRDDEMVIDAVRKIPSVTDAGQMMQIDPNKKFYAVAIIINRNNSAFVIPAFEPWPEEATAAVKPLWAAFQGSIKSGQVTPQQLAQAAAKHKFDPEQIKKECQERGIVA